MHVSLVAATARTGQTRITLRSGLRQILLTISSADIAGARRTGPLGIEAAGLLAQAVTRGRVPEVTFRLEVHG
jgi:hypothetical protein